MLSEEQVLFCQYLNKGWHAQRWGSVCNELTVNTRFKTLLYGFVLQTL